MQVTVELHGGVGNRLFQLCAGAQCAHLFKKTLVYMPEQDLQCLHATDWLHEVVQLETKTLSDIQGPWTTLYAKQLDFVDLQEASDKNILLKGWGFQKRWVSFLMPFMTSFLKEVQSQRVASAFFHIRQTDYLNQTFFNHLDIQIMQHYRKSLAHVAFEKTFESLWVTSDASLEAWKPLLDQSGISYTIQEGPSYETFLRMCQCSGGILSNSTFSLWAAQIQEHVWGLQTFFVPSPWFRFQRTMSFLEDFSPMIESSTDDRLVWDHWIRMCHQERVYTHEKLLIGLVALLIVTACVFGCHFFKNRNQA